MIYVDELRACGAPWAGGVACHMLSDQSEEELLSFAAALGLSRHWLQTRSLPHFDLSPAFRARALERGAIAVDWRAMVAAGRRLRRRLAARGVLADTKPVSPGGIETVSPPQLSLDLAGE
jgi:hypothetical protein